MYNCSQISRRITINERSILLIKLSVALVRNNVCSLKMIELSKHVGAN
jgi:hypothetical protein